jgi:hypothetical protein
VGAGRGQGAGRHGNQEIPPSPPESRVEVQSISESSRSKSTLRTTKAQATGPRNARFEDAVLIPHGIIIDHARRLTAGASQYFGTSPVPNDNYHNLEGLDHVKIWLDTSNEQLTEITAEYQEMRRRNLCEDEYATFAKENVFKGPRRAGQPAQDERFRIERMVNPSLQPDRSGTWEKPPRQPNTISTDKTLEEPFAGRSSSEWSWDVRPDCSYWLSLQGFNPKWLFQVKDVTYVKDGIVACPYFTIEFKRDGESDDNAIKQVAAAGSIALYNRFRLYRRAIRLFHNNQEKYANFKPTSWQQLRHFGLTFIGSAFEVWELKPVSTENNAWGGCTMQRLQGGDCQQSIYDTQELMRWTNEIHRWGLSMHGPSVKDEIKVCLNDGGVRTSDFGVGSS